VAGHREGVGDHPEQVQQTIWATRSRAVVPGRAQSLAEVFYEFIGQTVHQSAAHRQEHVQRRLGEGDVLVADMPERNQRLQLELVDRIRRAAARWCRAGRSPWPRCSTSSSARPCTSRPATAADWVKAMFWWPICPNETSGFSSNWWIGSILTAMPSALYMFLAVGLIALLTIWATRSRAVVPGRAQSLARYARTKPAASARTGGSDPS
jgi:hypothetical protein